MALAAQESSAADLFSLTLTADLTENAEYGERTLTISRHEVVVRDEKGTKKVTVPVGEIQSARSESLVSGGRIVLIKKTGELVVLVHYSLSFSESFSDAAHVIDELANDREVSFEINQEVKRCPKCGRLKSDDGPVCFRCVNRSKSLGRISRFLIPYKAQAALLILLALIATGVNLIPPYLHSLIIAEFESGSKDVNVLTNLLMIWAGALLVGVVFQVLNGRLMVYLGTHIAADLRSATYRAIEYLKLNYFDKKPVGAIASRVTQDTDRIWGFLVDGMPFFISNGLLLIGVLVILGFKNLFLTICIIAPFPVVILISMIVWKPISNLFFRVSQRMARVHMQIHESLMGIRVVKAFAREDHEFKKFNQRNHAMRDAAMYADQRWILAHGVMSIFTTMGQLILWTVGGTMLYQGKISVADLFLFFSYLFLVYGPLQWFAQVNNWFSRAMAGAERIFEIMDMTPETIEEEGQKHEVQGQVTFENVRFGYDKSNPILKGISFEAKAGQMIGLVGHSGAGKSTTINLVCRFYGPDQGRILIDGIDYMDLSLHDYRSQIGIVLQEPFLFHGSIRENISYGRPDAAFEDVMRAAKAANAHDFVLAKPEGYDTIVGERGARLSGGEKQRISIARAILHDPRILILDEATSSVDVETEKEIQQAINNLVTGRTTFAIAHRLSTLRQADRLLVIDRGRIVEEGSHEELMNQKGEFFKMVETQSQVNEIIGI
jgi:ATP-binding cassette subfamily B protein